MRFEARRGAATDRIAIARFVTDLVQQSFELRSREGVMPLEQAFARPVRATAIGEARSLGVVGTEPTGLREHRDIPVPAEERAAVERLADEGLITTEAVTALSSVLPTDAASLVDLSRQRFVVLGGTAELSPLSHLLRAGADVLTTHSSAASLQRRLRDDGLEQYSGRLYCAVDGVDLLRDAVEFSEAIVQFASDAPVHLVALAYKGGEGREWRLAAAMDGIIRRVLSAGRLASVTYYRSPSLITQISPRTAARSEQRLSIAKSVWTESLRLLTANTLFRPNVTREGGVFWALAMVPEQGSSYAAANVFGKTYAAEVYHADAQSSGTGAWRVSANVAPITATSSTDTPVTRVLFPHLRRLGVDVFAPAWSQRLMYLLLLSDLFGEAPRVDDVFTKQVHGGVFTSPWALNSLMTHAYIRSLSDRVTKPSHPHRRVAMMRARSSSEKSRP